MYHHNWRYSDFVLPASLLWTVLSGQQEKKYCEQKSFHICKLGIFAHVRRQIFDLFGDIFKHLSSGQSILSLFYIMTKDAESADLTQIVLTFVFYILGNDNSVHRQSRAGSPVWPPESVD